MKLRDRIKEFRRVKAGELLPNPKNWRTHGKEQRNALRGILAEVGIADAVLARKTKKGLMLIDGHLRAEEMPPDTLVPVLVLDVTEAEADKLLAVLDPIAGMADTDDAKLIALAAELDLASESLRDLVASLAPAEAAADGPAAQITETYSVVIECRSEDEQRRLFDKLTKEGHSCRLLIV